MVVRSVVGLVSQSAARSVVDSRSHGLSFNIRWSVDRYRSIGWSLIRLVSQSVDRSFDHSVVARPIQLVARPVCRSVSPLFRWSVIRSISHFVGRDFGLESSQSAGRPIFHFCHSVNKPVGRSASVLFG